MKEVMETFGRARLERSVSGYAIIVKKKLSDDWNQTPRPVKHVGERSYIYGLWNKMKKNEKLLKDSLNFFQNS